MPKKPTDQERILMFLLTDGAQFAFDLRGVKTPQGQFIGYSGDRRARELEEDGYLTVMQESTRPDGTGSKCAKYRLNYDGHKRAEAVYMEWETPLRLPRRPRAKQQSLLG